MEALDYAIEQFWHEQDMLEMAAFEEGFDLFLYENFGVVAPLSTNSHIDPFSRPTTVLCPNGDARPVVSREVRQGGPDTTRCSWGYTRFYASCSACLWTTIVDTAPFNHSHSWTPSVSS